MISLIEAKHYRCLRYVRQSLRPFQVLVGANASGKSTLLDVAGFLGDLAGEGLDEAIARRTFGGLEDLVWKHESDGFELAVEAAIPKRLKERLDQPYEAVRYEVAVGLEDNRQVLRRENLLFAKQAPPSEDGAQLQNLLFPSCRSAPDSLLVGSRAKQYKAVVSRSQEGKANFHPESKDESAKRWVYAYKLGPAKSALGNLPEDEEKFPIALWFRGFLTESVQRIELDSSALRKPSAPGLGRGVRTDGSNLPWVVADFAARAPDRFAQWVEHLGTALSGLTGVTTVLRPEDRHRYLVLEYGGGFSAPAWMVSDGTLRLLALTLPPYLDDLEGAYLIEEPENGIHPRAIETLVQSLSSCYSAQVLLATHSPVILGLVEPRDVLCLAKTPDGATDAVLGDRHPGLRDWRGDATLDQFFVSGVLG